MMEQAQDIGDSEKRPQFGNRILTDPKNVFEHNACQAFLRPLFIFLLTWHPVDAVIVFTLSVSYFIYLKKHMIGLYMVANIKRGGRTAENPWKEPPTHEKLLASFLTYPHWPNLILEHMQKYIWAEIMNKLQNQLHLLPKLWSRLEFHCLQALDAVWCCRSGFSTSTIRPHSTTHKSRPSGGGRFLNNLTDVFSYNNWDNVVWDEKQEEEARQITSQQLSTLVPDHDKEKFEENAFQYWNEFYMQHQNRFFKDRHWLFTEFPELLAGEATPVSMGETSQTVIQLNPSHQEVDVVKQHEQEMKKLYSLGCNMGVEGNSDIHSQDTQSIIKEGPTCKGASCVGSTEEINKKCSNVKRVDTDLRGVQAYSHMDQEVTESDGKKDGYPGEHKKYKILEVGCGVGNTVFPILQATNNPNLMVYCCDFSMTAIDLVKEHPDYNPSRCHAFVWDITDSDASIPLPKDSLDVIILIFVLSAIHPSKMQGVVDCLASYLRPGGVIVFRDYGRYDMAQLRFKPGRCLSENFYVRGDGTRVYFFTQDELREMFTRAGLVEDQNLIDRRLQVNRGRQLKMYRVWIQCKYRKPIHQSSERAASS